MTNASQQLLALAERAAAHYLQHSNIRAAMVTGSVARGISDSYSDIDMFFFYQNELPSEEQLDTIRRLLGGSPRKWQIGSRAEGDIAEAFGIGGVELQIGHATLAAWEAMMAEIQTKLTVGSPLAKAMEGMLIGKPLYGAPIIAAWQAQLADFPDALAEAMVRHHLHFFPAWGLIPYFHSRDATIWHYQILVESVHNLLGVLAGLNKIYFSTFQFKRARRFIAQMHIAPGDLGERIEQLFHSRPAVALPELEALVGETIALIEQHMPQIDTAPARQRIGWRCTPWRAEDFAAASIGG
jgi:hypothetical protein